MSNKPTECCKKCDCKDCRSVGAAPHCKIPDCSGCHTKLTSQESHGCKNCGWTHGANDCPSRRESQEKPCGNCHKSHNGKSYCDIEESHEGVEEIIDFERKGHLIRFYLGKNGKQWGDDWDDAPYEHNAGRVYDEFIKGFEDLVVPFDWEITEPRDHTSNSSYCKKDFVRRKVACLTLTKPDGEDVNVLFGDNVPNAKLTPLVAQKALNKTALPVASTNGNLPHAAPEKPLIPPGDCVYGCDGNKHFCGRYPAEKPIASEETHTQKGWMEEFERLVIAYARAHTETFIKDALAKKFDAGRLQGIEACVRIVGSHESPHTLSNCRLCKIEALK